MTDVPDFASNLLPQKSRSVCRTAPGEAVSLISFAETAPPPIRKPCDDDGNCEVSAFVEMICPPEELSDILE